MSSQLRSMVIVALVLLIVGSVAYVRSQAKSKGPDKPAAVTDITATATTQPNATTKPSEGNVGLLPRIVDLGAKSCIPCKQMAPILEELKIELAGRAKVEFIDVWENTSAGKEYGIRAIPTQIVYNSGGKEIWRHEGFIPKADIMSKLREAGMN